MDPKTEALAAMGAAVTENACPYRPKSDFVIGELESAVPMLGNR